MEGKEETGINRKKRWKIISIIPALFMMTVIFLFSAQTAEQSTQVSTGIGNFLFWSADDLLKMGLSEGQVVKLVETYQVVIRKAGHITEFMILEIFLMIPFFVYKIRGKKRITWPVVIGIVYAATDEIHQIFVPGRGPAVRDVGIDAIGIAIGLFFAWCFRLTGRPKKQRKKKKEI